MENENSTRSQYLDGKRELTDEDIIKILDLPNEKLSGTSIKSYTAKSYGELKENPEKLAELTEKLKTEEYLKYHDTYIAKSKLLYEQSAVLYNEIPCLIVLNEMKVPAYLLPYEYAKESDGVKREFADSLKNDYFTDFKRVFSSRINSAFKKGIQQGRDIFFLISNEKLDKEEIKRQLIDRVNYHDVEDRSGTYIFFSEKYSKCYSFEVDKKGQIGESTDADLKKFRLALSDKPLSLGEEINSSSSENILTDSYIAVNTTNSVFESLLARGAIEEFKTHRDIENRIERYKTELSKLEKLNEIIDSEKLKTSNNLFIQNEKQSRFYKELFTQNQTDRQGEKTMAQEKQIVAEIGFADGEIRQYEDSKEFLKDLDAATKENAYDTNFRVYAESDELKRKAADVKLDNYDPIEASERMHNGYEWNDVEHEAVQFTQSAEGRRLLKEAENGRLTMLDARDILDAVEKNGMNLRYDPLPKSYVVDGWTAADGEKLDNYMVSMSELKRLAGIEILENRQQNQFQEKENPRTPEEEQSYQEWLEMLEDNQQAEDIIERMQGVQGDEQIEKIQVNGGMNEAAMEAEIAAEENPRPDFIDEQGNPHWFDEEEPEEPVDMSGYEFAEYIHSSDFIDKFGDWEKANRLEKLKNAESIIGNESITIEGVDVSDLVAKLRKNYSKENLKQLQALARDAGRDVIEKLRQEQNIIFPNPPVLKNLDSKKDFKFQMTGINEIKNHDIFKKGHIEAISSIPDIVEKGIFISTEQNEDGRKPQYVKFHYFASGYKLDDEDYTAKIVFAETEDGELFYDQSLSEIEKGRLIDILQEKNKLETSSPQKNSKDSFEQKEILNPLISQENLSDYDKRLINICQVPQMPYLEKNPVTGKWQPTQEAVELVKKGQLHVEKNGQEYKMIDSRTELNQKTEYPSSSAAIENSNSSLETETLAKAGELLKNMQFTPENYKKLLNVINEISDMNGLKNLAVPKEEEITEKMSFKDVVDSVSETKVGETLKSIAEHGAGLPEGSIQSAQAIQDKLYEVVHGDTKTEHPGKTETNENSQEQPQTQLFDGKSEIVFGETTLPVFSVLVDGKMRSIENAVINGHNKETGSYFVEANGEKIELPKETFNTLYKDKIEQEQQKARLAEGKTIVFEDKEQGIKGTEIPEWSMYTTKGLESFKGFVTQKFNQTDNTYILSNGDSTITVSAARFKEITAPERFENKFDENSPSWKKLCEKQYKDFFETRDNTAYNFKHNLSVFCRKEANSPVDALHLAKDIVSKMSKEQQKQTKKLLKTLAYENETTNELITRIYHEAVKEQPLNEDYMKSFQQEKVVAWTMPDTVSGNGQKVDNDPALIKGERDRNLKIGMSLKNVNMDISKLFGKGNDTMHFDELKVISATKEGNSITVMDGNKSYFKLPRDTVLNVYKEQQMREMRQEQKQNRSNTMSLSYA